MPDLCCILLPSSSLSPAGGAAPSSIEKGREFSELDADPIIKEHAVHWLLCIESYQERRRKNVGSWKLLYQDVEACLYGGHSCAVIMAFRGTKTPKDLYDDALIATGSVCPRARQAVQYIHELVRLNPLLDITLTGHSLGGAVAREVGKALSLKVITFNAAAPPSAPVVSGEYEIGYHVVFDFISAWQTPNTIRIDKDYWPVPALWALIAVPFIWLWHIFDGILPAHALHNFSNRRPGEVVSAQTEDSYLRKWFSTLPLSGRSYVLWFFFGVSGNLGYTLPSVESC